MHQAQYPFKEITAPNLKDTQLIALINNLPPAFLKPPALYIAIAVAFIFVVVVFI
jgi:hypothetical protein